MRYFIDGYNLIFRSGRFSSSELKNSRMDWIGWLNLQKGLLHGTITIVFDSAYVPGEIEKSHSGSVEILYTAQGETADQWIINQLAWSKKRINKSIIVVTSDNQLAKQVRHLGAHTQSIEEFLRIVDRRVEKKEHRLCANPIKTASFSIKLTSELIKKPLPATPLLALPLAEKGNFSASSEQAFTYYLSSFEKKLQLQQEEEKNIEKKPHKEIHLKRKKKKISPPLLVRESEEERWQRLFVKRCETEKE